MKGEEGMGKEKGEEHTATNWVRDNRKASNSKSFSTTAL